MDPWGAPCMDIPEYVGRPDDDTLVKERLLESELVDGLGIVAQAAAEVALHVEPRVARVLRIEDARSRAYRPGGPRAPGNTEPWGEIGVIGGDQSVPQTAVARSLNVALEPHDLVLVKIA